jgi:NTE family protein
MVRTSATRTARIFKLLKDAGDTAIVILAATLSFPYSVLRAQAESSAPHRPKIGLVLSGGGAPGVAHVDVLKALEELRIPIDCIAGTSVGARCELYARHVASGN